LVLVRPALHWTIERQLTNTLQAQVRIERVRFSILSAELHLAGLRVFDRSNGRPLLHASSLDLVLRLRSLLRGALDFQTVRIDRPEAWLSLTSAGVAWPVGSWNPSGTSSGWAVAVSDLEAKGGRIHLSDRRSGTEHEETIGEIRIRLRNLSTRTDHADGRVPVSGAVRWRGMTITAEGWVTPFARRPEFSVPVVVRDADLAALRDLLPAGVAAAEPAGLAAGTIELRGARGDAWAADAAFRGEVRTASGRAAPSILVSGDLLQVEGAGRLDDAGVALTQLRASLSDGRLTLRGADGATGEEGERPLAIRQATLALLEPVADLSRPVPFETHVTSSIASTIGFRGSWVSETARLQGRLAVQGLDLEAAQAWLRAAPAWHVAGVAEAELETDLRFVEGDVAGTLSGTSRIQGLVANGDRGAVAAKELDAQSDRFDIALASSWSATGSVRMRATDFRVRDGSETKGEAAAVSATDLESVLRTMRLEGDGRRGLVVTESGEIAVRGMRGRAPSLGIEAVDTGALRANLRSLRLDFTHEGFQGQVSARLSVATASGRMEEGAVRSWAADAVRVESATLSTAPPIVSLGSVEADRLAVEVVRRGQPTTAPVVEPEGRGWPGVSIDRIAVRQGRIAFRDESVRPAWSATLDSVEARIDHLRTDRDAAAELEISAHESSGATLRVSGRLHPSSRRADVRLAVENLDALRPAPYLPEALRHVVRGGTASARLALRMALEGDVPRVEGTGTITLAPLELGDTTRGFTLLLAEQAELQLDRLRLDPRMWR
jgi:hypothetical protein